MICVSLHQILILQKMESPFKGGEMTSLARNECFERALPLNNNSKPSEVIKMTPYSTQALVPSLWLRLIFKVPGEGRPGRLGAVRAPS